MDALALSARFQPARPILVFVYPHNISIYNQDGEGAKNSNSPRVHCAKYVVSWDNMFGTLEGVGDYGSELCFDRRRTEIWITTVNKFLYTREGVMDCMTLQWVHSTLALTEEKNLALTTMYNHILRNCIFRGSWSKRQSLLMTSSGNGRRTGTFFRCENPILMIRLVPTVVIWYQFTDQGKNGRHGVLISSEHHFHNWIFIPGSNMKQSF